MTLPRSESLSASLPPLSHAPTKGKRTWLVARLAAPAVAEQVLNISIGVVAILLVGHLGPASIAAVSFSNQIMMLGIALVPCVATGGTVLIARAVGGGDQELACRTVSRSLQLGTGLGLLTMALIALFSRRAVQLLGAADDALPLAAGYLRAVSCTLLPATWVLTFNACLRGAGDTRTPMRIMVLINAANALVASALVYGPFGLPKLGVMGPAVGAIVAWTFGGILVVVLLWRGWNGLQLEWRTLEAMDLGLARAVLRLGTPAGIEMILTSLADLSFLRVLATLGTTACAAHAVVMSIQTVSVAQAAGFSIATTTLVGQALGAHDAQRAEGDVYSALSLGAGVMMSIGLAFLVLARPLVALFANDLQVVTLGARALQITAIGQPMLAASLVLSGALRGAGDTRQPMLINGISVWIVRLGLALLFVRGLRLGFVGSWMAMVIDLVVRATVGLLWFRTGDWKRIQIWQASPGPLPLASR